MGGVQVRDLAQIHDKRGEVWHFLKRGDPEFGDGIGEVYFSTVAPFVFKGWHLHTRMTLRYVCVQGVVDVFLLDERDPTTRLFARVRLSPSNYRLLTIPPGISNAFMSATRTGAMIANAASIRHDPGEIVRREPAETDFPLGVQPSWTLAG